MLIKTFTVGITLTIFLFVLKLIEVLLCSAAAALFDFLVVVLLVGLAAALFDFLVVVLLAGLFGADGVDSALLLIRLLFIMGFLVSQNK
jgi:hypothetical protein